MDPTGLLTTPSAVLTARSQIHRATRRRLGLRMTAASPGAAPDDPMAVLWNRVLCEALPDPDVRRFLQVLAGMTLTGLARDDVFVALLGDGENGKSTVLEAMVAALGGIRRAHPNQDATPPGRARQGLHPATRTAPRRSV